MASTALRRDELASERIAGGILPKVLGPFDMVAIFVAIVLFANQGSVIQAAGAAGFIYWILGFVTFLIPGAIVTGQLGLMFPGEGSIYVWTHKALGSFWGFFAGFCAWWPGVLVMVATADLIVTMLQFLNSGWLQEPWQQGVVILAVIWFSTALSLLRFRVTQNMVNAVFVIYGAAIAAVALAGIAWLLGGHPVANDFSRSAFSLTGSNATFYGLVILALLGIEVPLNMGVEIKDRRAITSYLFWGSLVVIVAYLLLTFGAMVVVPQKDANSTTAILQAVQRALGTPAGTVVTLILIAFFLFNTTVYNYSFARLLFVSGLDRRLPAIMGRVNRNKVPHVAVLTQAVITTIITAITFIVFSGNLNLSTEVYIVLQAAVTVIWCLSMIILFIDVLVIRQKYPSEFKEAQLVHTSLFVVAAGAGAIASAVGIWVTLSGSWNTALIANGPWLLIVGGVAVASMAVAAVVYMLGASRGAKAEAPSTP
ncbi:MAG TPA: APC family permease [Candidatus Limnocylindrales bacterium]|nr:APC family permease [Candidatus Limnocylindrales bacterium]